MNPFWKTWISLKTFKASNSMFYIIFFVIKFEPFGVKKSIKLFWNKQKRLHNITWFNLLRKLYRKFVYYHHLQNYLYNRNITLNYCFIIKIIPWVTLPENASVSGTVCMICLTYCFPFYYRSIWRRFLYFVITLLTNCSNS